MTEQEIVDFIGNEIGDTEFIADMTYDDYDPILEVTDNDGNVFEVSVKKIK